MRKVYMVAAVLLSGCSAAQVRAALDTVLDLGNVVCQMTTKGEPWAEYTCAAVNGMSGLEAMPQTFKVKVHRDAREAFEVRYGRK